MPRLFFAALPDERTRARLAALVAELLREAERASDALSAEPLRDAGRTSAAPAAVPSENYHLTLAFVGAVPDAQVALLRAMGAALRGAPCEVELEALEHWPPAGVLVLAARSCPPELALIHSRLTQALARAGFVRDPERFRPHVTLARKVTQAPVPARVPPLAWRVRDVALLASDTSGKTSRYTVLGTWPLLDESADS